MKKKVIYNFTNIAPHYRSSLWSKLLNDPFFDFHFAFGKNKRLNIKEIDFSKSGFIEQNDKLHSLNNFWIKDKILIFQMGVIKMCLTRKIDVAIFLGEFQVISTWIASFICKLKGVKVVYWTHGLYGNEGYWKRSLRVIFYKLADELLLYERRAKELLVNQGLKEEKLRVIFNSLDYDTHKKLRNSKEIIEVFNPNFFKNNDLPYLIFVGRLTKVKKLDLLIEALSALNKKGLKLNLLLVGDGIEKESLKSLVFTQNMKDYIHFYGACYDEEILAKYIYHATLCVSPGNVGLTAIHSLSFGTPVCTHKNFLNQMPEVGIIEDEKTGVFFEENNLESLKEVIKNWLKKSKSRESIRKNCFKAIDSFYNPYYQIEIIKNL